MMTLEDIKHAVERLSLDGRAEIHRWLDQLAESRTRFSGVREPQHAYVPDPPLMTFEEFLEFAQRSPLRYEYVNGVVQAMNAPSLAHSRVAEALFVAIREHLRSGRWPCEAFVSGVNLKIQSETDEIDYVPDVLVACNPAEWDEKWVCNPKLVAEVLSPSTRYIDTREKATNYRRVESIEEFLLLEQSELNITVFRRAEHWRPRIYIGADAVLELRSIGLSIALARIYEGMPPAS
jgi:Uma2 family endonuclease